MVKHGKLVFEYNQITPYIYIGTDLCCKLHFKKSLIKKRIKADISLEEEKIDHPKGAEYYLWIPTKNKTPPTQKQLLLGSDFINQLVKNKIKLYVHCRRGHGRAPTLVAAYFISKGMGVKQAIETIRKKGLQFIYINLKLKHLRNLRKN
jgi:protein-tyrosine phosphatase